MRTIFGITKNTMQNYRIMMAYGLSHDVAMRSLKAIYSMNVAEAAKQKEYNNA